MDTMKKSLDFHKLFVVIIFVLSSVIPHSSKAQLSCGDFFIPTASTLHPNDVNSLTVQILQGEMARYNSWTERTVIRFMQKSIREKVQASCAEISSCTQKNISQLVTNSVEETFKKVDIYKAYGKKIRGYAILTGISVGIAISSQFLKTSLPANAQWLSDFVTIASSIGLYKIGAPLWDYIGGITARGAFRVNDGKSFFRDSAETARYESYYKLLQEKMTPREQQQTVRLSNLTNAVESALSSAIESIQSKDPSKGGIERAAARVASLAIKIKNYFPEVSAEDPDLVRTIQMSFVQFIGNEEVKLKLLNLTMQQIEKYDDTFSNAQTSEIYKKSIKKWLALK